MQRSQTIRSRDGPLKACQCESCDIRWSGEMGGSEFDAFYRKSRDGCFRALIVALADASEAEDLLAEAYTRALELWPKVRSHPAPEAWVITVAMNLHRDRWRRARRAIKGSMVREVMDRPDLPIDPRLLAAIGSLPFQQRRVLALRVMMDLDTGQTAQALGIVPGTVTTHLHRALESLRSALNKEEVS